MIVSGEPVDEGGRDVARKVWAGSGVDGLGAGEGFQGSEGLERSDDQFRWIVLRARTSDLRVVTQKRKPGQSALG